MGRKQRDRSRESSGSCDYWHIKSYVLRSTHMSAHQRRSYSRLSPYYCVPFSSVPCDPSDFFPKRANPVVAEIGFGMGDATAEIAHSNPEVNYLGIEVHRPGIGKLLGRIEAEAIENLRIVHHDAMMVFEQMLKPESLHGIHLFFPDPWQKKRHHKRRLIRPSFTPVLRDHLENGGYLYMVTDWQDYAESALEILTQTDGLANSFPVFANGTDWRPQTAFERKGIASDHKVWELYFTRV